MADTHDLSEKLEQTHLDEQQAQEEPTEALFDPTMKKKKKKKKKIDLEGAADEDDTAAAPGAETEGEALFADLKKKKKKKAKPAFDDDVLGGGADAATAGGDGEAVAATAGEGADAFDFSDLKKKKKKSKKVNFAAFEAELNDGGDLSGATSKDSATGAADGGSGAAEEEEPWLNSDRDYSYPELLGRFFKLLRQNNPELVGEKKRYSLMAPQMAREGNKKTIFVNIADMAKRMHRQLDHLIQFLFAELGTSGSVDGSQRLVIKGRFSQAQIENVIRRYISEYVSCKTCKSYETILIKENRLFFLQCEACGSTRSVSAIKTGFQAQTTKRAILRRAAA
ncbi:translation initiation factor eIF-2 beta subunit [Dimargaris verticillata]|uniref:Translation initiation factor eIF-2 beta subunit n=1 Tax=Dimargaris verticillata TaxID=2761393 RepID=A0A9W8ECI5_9FUNG|nr:translation initiation factor eIF-2 beta subunit [Dimargaris verticillata]